MQHQPQMPSFCVFNPLAHRETGLGGGPVEEGHAGICRGTFWCHYLWGGYRGDARLQKAEGMQFGRYLSPACPFPNCVAGKQLCKMLPEAPHKSDLKVWGRFHALSATPVVGKLVAQGQVRKEKYFQGREESFVLYWARDFLAPAVCPVCPASVAPQWPFLAVSVQNSPWGQTPSLGWSGPRGARADQYGGQGVLPRTKYKWGNQSHLVQFLVPEISSGNRFLSLVIVSHWSTRL